MRTKVITAEVLEQLLSQQFVSRFSSNVKVGELHECWPWERRIQKNGYGSYSTKFFKKPMTWMTHRLAWIIRNRCNIPDGLYILHSCNNPVCCNPDHLRAGTQRDNLDQMTNENRRVSLKGIDAPSAKLTEDKVREIRAMYATGKHTTRGLGDLFGVRGPTISGIVRKKLWAHVQ